MVTVRTKWIDLGVGIASVAMALGVFVLSAGFPEPHDAQLGAAVFPRIVAVALAVFGCSIALRALAGRTTGVVTIANAARVSASFAVLLAYGLLLKRVGFLVLTPLFIASVLGIMRFSRPLRIALVSILSTACIYVLFRLLLSVPLPEGILPLQ